MTIHGLNIVAWGAILFFFFVFFLLLSAAPAMNRPTKEAININSPHKMWLETDSRIFNALFYVMGFGLAPQRFRDL